MKLKNRFSLVEMLTIIAIIAVLTGLILPAVMRSRNTAAQAACASNQRQTMLILKQAILDNDSFFVSGTSENTAPVYWSKRLYDKNRVQNYKIFRCPAMTCNSKATEDPQYVYGAVYCGSADGFDFRGPAYFKTSSDAAPISPSALALGGCSTTKNAELCAMMDFSSTAISNNTGKPSGIHNKQVNLFFYDGHVAAVKSAELGKFYYPDYSNKRAAPIASKLYDEALLAL